MSLQPEERQKVKTETGHWFTKFDKKQFMYILLTSKAYPER